MAATAPAPISRRRARTGTSTGPAARTAVERAAAFDATGRYRYSLTRRWSMGTGTVAFVLLNPSTADAERDDPTIRRCMGFARAWGYAAVEVVNLFAWRATRPQDLRRVARRNPVRAVGAENDAWLSAAARRAERTVLAWGVHGALAGRDAAVLALLAGVAPGLWCLGRTQGGHPRHVLYLPRAVQPVEFAGAVPLMPRDDPPGTAARAGRARRPARR